MADETTRIPKLTGPNDGFYSWVTCPLTVKQAAREMNCSVPTLRKMVRNGEITPSMMGTRPRFPRWALLKWQQKAGSVFNLEDFRAIFNGLAGAI